MLNKIIIFLEERIVFTYLILSILFGFLTYFVNYTSPNSSIWDEVYHISSAQKYLNKVQFMEAHPPLGKLFMALGEKLINPNTEYSKLNVFGKLCLSSVPGNYKYTNDKNEVVEQTKVKTSTGGERQMTLLDVREIKKAGVDKSSFLTTDAISTYPEYFSFCGFRFFPVVFASLIPMLVFVLVYLLIKNPHLALFSAALVTFDNALLVHFRSAMLDSIQMFFILLSLIFCVKILNSINNIKRVSIWNYVGLCTSLGLTIATKHNGVLFLLLLALCVGFEYYKTSKLPILMPKSIPSVGVLLDTLVTFFKLNFRLFVNLVSKLIICLCFVFIIYSSVFFTHISLGQNIESKNGNNNGVYKASNQYLEAILAKDYTNFTLYAKGLEDNLTYMDNYHKGVPKLNLKSETENGSYPTNWLVMNRAISYRWDAENTKSSNPDEREYRYIYLIGNPFVWLSGIIAIFSSVNIIFGKLFLKVKIKRKSTFNYLLLFSLLYFAYMASMLYAISVRVMYLYHYLVPLVLSLILVPLVLDFFFGETLENQELEILPDNKPFLIYLSIIIYFTFILFGFVFFAPFTYHLPLSGKGFDYRNWFDFWQLKKAK